ncbi:MAG: hypothetical protein KC731_06335, partial [Myxococcales bacterium]|nr:hypothetical protein [Myxococcales bacterium]
MRRRAWAIGAAVVLALPLLGHGAALQCAAMAPPAVDIGRLRDPVPASDDPDRRELGTSWARHRGAIHEVRLEGTPEELGYANVALLYDDQVAIERDLHQQFEHFVPYAAARSLIVDVARLRFGPLDQRLSPSYRRELAAQAMAFSPDPFTSLMDTYPRFVFLHSLYDILLSFERSPLIGCTSFVLRPPLTRGHTLVGRNFDFEGPQTLDDHKAVFLILEDGHIPFASVSWPGFIGVTTGMNAEGLTVVLHGARAGDSRSHGEPVAQTIRELLATTHTTREALALLDHRDPMVPHMLLVADGTGDA